jgi:hypothetical protein
VRVFLRGGPAHGREFDINGFVDEFEYFEDSRVVYGEMFSGDFKEFDGVSGTYKLVPENTFDLGDNLFVFNWMGLNARALNNGYNEDHPLPKGPIMQIDTKKIRSRIVRLSRNRVVRTAAIGFAGIYIYNHVMESRGYHTVKPETLDTETNVVTFRTPTGQKLSAKAQPASA